MPYYQNVKLPKRTKQALVGSPNVPNVSKAVRDVMLKYAGNKEATFALLLRHMQRKMVSGHKATQEEMCKTTVSSDPNLYKEFAEIEPERPHRDLDPRTAQPAASVNPAAGSSSSSRCGSCTSSMPISRNCFCPWESSPDGR